MPNAPEPNVSIYAKLAFHALFDGFRELNLDSVGTFMFFGVTEVLQGGVIEGRDILRFKRLCKDVILEGNTLFLFTREVSPLIVPLVTLLEAEDPPAPKSKAPSCRSEWYQSALGNFFDVYDNRYAQREPVSNLLINWLESYKILVEDEPERSVFVSRFKEAFEPLNKRYRSPPAQLVLAEPVALPEPIIETARNQDPSIWDQIHGSEFRIITAEEEADIMADYQSPIPPSNPGPSVQDVASPSIVKTPDEVRQAKFMDRISVQHRLTIDPITLDAKIDPATGKPYAWQEFTAVYTDWPSLRPIGEYLVFSSTSFRDPDRNNHEVYMGGYIYLDGVKTSQGSLENFLTIETSDNGPKLRCRINRTPLRSGLTGKVWVNEAGIPKGDLEGSYQWFVVSKCGDSSDFATSYYTPTKPWWTDGKWNIWLVPEYVHIDYVAKLKKEARLRP